METKWTDSVQKHHNEAKGLGHNVLGTFLQGSQNYGMAHSGSDVDTKSLVIPSFRDLCRNAKTVSYTHVRENNEHIDIKDVRLMFQNFLKQNINMVELMFTNYYVVEPEYKNIWETLLTYRETVVRYNPVQGINCCAGMAYEKMKALKHPYPSLIDKIEKYGYDPKQLHHILRMEDFIQRFFMDGEKFADCLIPTDKEYLLSVKTEAMPLFYAEDKAKKAVENIDAMKSAFLKREHEVNEHIPELLHEVVEMIFRKAYSELF